MQSKTEKIREEFRYFNAIKNWGEKKNSLTESMLSETEKRKGELD